MSGVKKPTSELKAAVALVMVLEFGLAAMKPYISEILKLSNSCPLPNCSAAFAKLLIGFT